MVSNNDESGPRYTQEQKQWLLERRTKTQKSWYATTKAFNKHFQGERRSLNTLKKIYATIDCHEKRLHHDYLKEATEWLLNRRQTVNESWPQTTAAHMLDFPYRPKTMRSLQLHWSRQRSQSKLRYHEWSLDEKCWLQQNSNNDTSWKAILDAFKEKFDSPDLTTAAIRQMSHHLELAKPFSHGENGALMGLRPNVLTPAAALQLANGFRILCPQVERSMHDIVK